MTLPISLDLRAKRCLVVGSGEEAERRVEQFVTQQAEVIWISTIAHAPRKGVAFAQRPFQDEDVLGAWLVVLTDRDDVLAARMAARCAAQRTFFCAIDQPAHNSFSHMALVQASPVTLAIATDGRAPGLARKLQSLFRTLFTQDVTEFFQRVAERRAAQPDALSKRAQLAQDLAELKLQGHFELPTLNEPKSGDDS